MEYFAIGLMSGTSLDGLDICYVNFRKDNHWTFEILKAETSLYEEAWEAKLKNNINLNAADLFELHSTYGFYLAEKVQNFIKKFNIRRLDVIASHGHTVFHQPKLGFTVQIGDGRAIKLLNNFPVVYDFRSQDVLMGGNGAPLVPIGDRLLFPAYDACVNLGGFSNISFEHEGKRIAFDIGPVNIVLNEIASEFGKKYDAGGLLASYGKFSQTLFEELNKLDFYHLEHPKSLGAEWVNKHVFPILANYSREEKITTFTKHAALQIAEILNKFKLKKTIFTGGGVYNSELMRLISEASLSEVFIPEKQIIEYKEALIFAFMGVLRLREEINVLSSATGSKSDHCSGLLI